MCIYIFFKNINPFYFISEFSQLLFGNGGNNDSAFSNDFIFRFTYFLIHLLKQTKIAA